MQKTLIYQNSIENVETIEKTESKVTFEHIPSLDGIRAVAVLVVLFYHSILVFPHFRTYFKGGFLGVDIFFVLSGFLITSILLKEFSHTETLSLKKFYVRRFLRLTPAYWFHLLFMFLSVYHFFPIKDANKLFENNTFWYALGYLTNWQSTLGDPDGAGLLSHTWSLAVEEQFYLFWALVLYLMLNRMKRKTIVYTTLALIIGTMFFRAWRVTDTASLNYLYSSFDSRIDALLVGCFFSQIISWKFLSKEFLSSSLFNNVGFAGCSVAVLIFFSVYDSYNTRFLYNGGFTVFAFAVGIVILWIATHKSSKVNYLLQIKPLVWIGKTSYGIYLWHAAAISFTAQFSWFPATKLLVALILTFAATAISYYVIELPFLRQKEHFKAL